MAKEIKNKKRVRPDTLVPIPGKEKTKAEQEEQMGEKGGQAGGLDAEAGKRQHRQLQGTGISHNPSASRSSYFAQQENAL